MSRRALGSHLKRSLHNPGRVAALSDAPLNLEFPHPAQSNHLPQVCYKNPQNLHRVFFFPTASSTRHRCSWAPHGKPSTARATEAVIHPLATASHTLGRPWAYVIKHFWSLFGSGFVAPALRWSELFVGDSTARYEEAPAQATGTASPLTGRPQWQSWQRNYRSRASAPFWHFHYRDWKLLFLVLTCLPLSHPPEAWAGPASPHSRLLPPARLGHPAHHGVGATLRHRGFTAAPEKALRPLSNRWIKGKATQSRGNIYYKNCQIPALQNSNWSPTCFSVFLFPS